MNFVVITMSDESEYDVEPEELDIYKKKYQLLLERCEVLQQVKSRSSGSHYRRFFFLTI